MNCSELDGKVELNRVLNMGFEDLDMNCKINRRIGVI